MSLINFLLTSGRVVRGSIPFMADSVNEPIKSLTIDHPQLYITLTGPYYFVFNERMVSIGGLSQTSTVVGVYDGMTAKGYKMTSDVIRPVQLDLNKIHYQTREKMFKRSG